MMKSEDVEMIETSDPLTRQELRANPQEPRTELLHAPCSVPHANDETQNFNTVPLFCSLFYSLTF
jgi:hypothetical protein